MPPSFGIDVHRYSTFSALVRVTAVCARFVSRLRKKKTPTGPLTADELKNAENMWLRLAQHEHHSDVYQALTSDRPHSLISQLNLFIDEDGLIRCRGRLQNASLCYESKYPVLVPRKHPLTVLLVQSCHQKVMYGGVSHTLSRVSYKYWIPKGRAVIKSILSKCRVCQRHESGPYASPVMAPLPASRVTEARPFSHVGIDYFGPVSVKFDPEPAKGMGLPVNVHGHQSYSPGVGQ